MAVRRSEGVHDQGVEGVTRSGLDGLLWLVMGCLDWSGWCHTRQRGHAEGAG